MGVGKKVPYLYTIEISAHFFNKKLMKKERDDLAITRELEYRSS